MLVGIVTSILVASSLMETILFAAIASTLLGALFLSGRRKSLEVLDKRAYVTGGGRMGDVRVWPRLTSEPSQKGENIATPSGMRSTERIEKAVPTWLTGETVGLAMIVAGGIMLASVYLLGFG